MKKQSNPESNYHMQIRLPEAAVQRDILIKKRDEYLAHAFDADAEIEGLSVQQPASSGGDAKEESLANLRTFAANCRKSAARMDELIAKIPAASPLGISPFLQ